jgi:DNA-binding protein H-NS
LRTVAQWFGNLSFDQQRDALSQIQEVHKESVAAKRTELEKQLAALGYDAPKRLGRPKNGASLNGHRGRSKGVAISKKRSVVKAKYRDSKTGETWSGRGRMASWLKTKVDAGEKQDKYLV